MSCRKKYLITTLLITLATSLVYLWFPAYQDSLICEDLFIENVTALLHLGGTLACVYFYLKTQRNKSFIWLFVIMLLGFVEEVSFGERMFDIPMPVVANIKIDSIHDIFYLLFVLITDALDMLGLLLCASGVFVVLLGVVLKHRAKLLHVVTTLRNNPPHDFILYIGFFLVFSLIIDLEFVRDRSFIFLEELAELHVATGLIFYCYCLYRKLRTQSTA